MACESTTGLALWQRRVLRLAEEFQRSDHGMREDFASFSDRACVACGEPLCSNVRIFRPEEPQACGDRLYQPDAPGRRDGYWYACAVLGIDPERAAKLRAQPIPAARIAELDAACASVGLAFAQLA